MEAAEAIAREGIRDTLARYHFAGDRGRLDELVACFTPDGVLEVDGEARCEGRGAIRERMQAAVDELTGAARAPLLRHHLTTNRIQVESADRARVWSYFLAVTEIGPDHSGRYRDVVARLDGGWLLAHRRVSLDWVAETSRYSLAR